MSFILEMNCVNYIIFDHSLFYDMHPNSVCDAIGESICTTHSHRIYYQMCSLDITCNHVDLNKFRQIHATFWKVSRYLMHLMLLLFTACINSV